MGVSNAMFDSRRVMGVRHGSDASMRTWKVEAFLSHGGTPNRNGCFFFMENPKKKHWWIWMNIDDLGLPSKPPSGPPPKNDNGSLSCGRPIRLIGSIEQGNTGNMEDYNENPVNLSKLFIKTSWTIPKLCDYHNDSMFLPLRKHIKKDSNSNLVQKKTRNK